MLVTTIYWHITLVPLLAKLLLLTFLFTI